MELAKLLSEAEVAPPGRRIEWRDPIAAYGTRAIEAVRPWLASPLLAAFAIRVIERAGAAGDFALATRVLREDRGHVPSRIVSDVDWALRRLRVVTQRAAQIPDAANPVAGRAPDRRPRT